jgi:hypothetical protein
LPRVLGVLNGALQDRKPTSDCQIKSPLDNVAVEFVAASLPRQMAV